MAPAPSLPGFGRPTLRRRTTSLALALLANALLLVMLFTLAPAPSPRPRADRQPTTVTLLPDADDTPRHTTQRETKRSEAARRTPRPAKKPAPQPAAVASPVPPPLNMILLDGETFAASDIARLPAAPAAAPAATDGAGQDRAGDSRMAAGRGPGGEPLYNAEWYREPTDAELGGYLPRDRPRVGWGEIACRTVTNYRVEDCVELGQTPPGSGLARAVRLAAWQFRVRPARVGGKALIGAWVRIRVDFSQKAAN